MGPTHLGPNLHAVGSTFSRPNISYSFRIQRGKLWLFVEDKDLRHTTSYEVMRCLCFRSAR